MKLILHIGSEKTGTSSIQGSLAKLREELAEHSIFYPRAFGYKSHIGLINSFQKLSCIDELRRMQGLHNKAQILFYKKTVWSNFLQELEGARPDLVVLSNEHLSSRLNTYEEISELAGFLKPLFAEIKIVFYVRKQDDLLISQHKSEIFFGNKHKDFSVPEEDAIPHSYNFKKIVGLWCSCFGQDSLKLVDYHKVKGNLLPDFFALLGFKLPDGFELVTDNKSLDGITAEYLRHLNEFIPGHISSGYNNDRDNLIETLLKFELPGSTSCDRLGSNFMSYFECGNTSLSQEYSVDDQKLFGDVEPVKAIERVDLSLNDTFCVMSKLWIAQQEKIKNLEVSCLLLKLKGLMAEEKYEDAFNLAYSESVDHIEVWNIRHLLADKFSRHELVRQARFRALNLYPAVKKLSIVSVYRGDYEAFKMMIPSRIHPDVENVIVDCSSSDLASAWLKENYADVKLVKLSRPELFSSARVKNFGLLSSRGEYICMAGADVIINPEFFNILPRLESANYYVRIPMQAHIHGNKDMSVSRTGVATRGQKLSWLCDTAGTKDQAQDNLVDFTIFPRSVFSMLCGYDIEPEICGVEDVDFRMQLLFIAGRKEVCLSPGVINSCWHHPEGVSPGGRDGYLSDEVQDFSRVLERKYGTDWEAMLAAVIGDFPSVLTDSSL
jgi:hypothetical protein